MAAEQNQLGYDQGMVAPDQCLLSMKFHNRLRREDSTLSPINKMLLNEKRERRIDVQYWISGAASAELASPPLPSDSKALRSESDIFATSARGS